MVTNIIWGLVGYIMGWIVAILTISLLKFSSTEEDRDDR